MAERTLYLDYAATTPVRESVKKRVCEMLALFGNPSSLHRIGMEAENVLNEARKSVLSSLSATNKGRILFTGGGTEANNLAIIGTARQLTEGRRRHIVTTAIEHPAVLEPMKWLEQQGFEVTYITPNACGDISCDDILSAVRADTVLVSVMHVNNETGATMPVAELAQELYRHKKVRFHVDGTQAFGKIPVSLSTMPVDLYTVSAHKIGGLKGTGALYVREGVRLSPIVMGGGQEFGLRSGTENVVGIAAMAEAAKHAAKEAALYEDKSTLRQRFVDELSKVSGWTVHTPKRVSPYIVSASLEGLRGEIIVHAFESHGLYVSSGSACSTARGQNKRSHVLSAMELASDLIEASVRFSWSPTTDEDEVLDALSIIEQQTGWLQKMVGR